jgi:hypothetical protein
MNNFLKQEKCLITIWGGGKKFKIFILNYINLLMKKK